MPTATEPAARDILVEAEGWERAPFQPGEALAAARAAADAAVEVLELGDGIGFCVLLADDAALQQLNRDYRGKDRPTNVLSFPAFDSAEALPAAGHIGDIAVALETVLAESLDARKPPLQHLSHMVAHGVAHLAGWDHEDDAEAEEMEAIEREALARLGLPDPYRDGALEA